MNELQGRLMPEELFPRLSPAQQAAQQRMLEELPMASSRVMDAAAKCDWFIGWTGTLGGVIRLTRKLEKLDSQAIDECLTGLFRDNFSVIAEELIERYPHRAEAIEPAVSAHLRGDAYALSVPVFLAQADGLLSELLKKESALSKVRNKPDLIKGETVAAYLLRTRNLPERDTLLLGSILNIHNLDILLGSNDRNNKKTPFTALNRHQILHGEISDYGTEQNSLKAFSFLHYVGLHVSQFIDAPLK